MRSYAVIVRNPLVALALLVLLLAVGAALFVVGLTMLAAVAVVGVVLGTALASYRRMRGRSSAPPVLTHREFDPALEVFPPKSPPPRSISPATLERKTPQPRT